jgi:ariadne-1
MISCLGVNCASVISDDLIKSLLILEPSLYDSYTNMINTSYILSSSTMKFCPFPDCKYVIQRLSSSSSSSSSNSSDASTALMVPPITTCKCGHTFCFHCLDADHAPAPCHLVKLWIKKCQDDSETANWVIANTKDCPNCSTAIEKNGGW